MSSEGPVALCSIVVNVIPLATVLPSGTTAIMAVCWTPEIYLTYETEKGQRACLPSGGRFIHRGLMKESGCSVLFSFHLKLEMDPLLWEEPC